MATAGPWSGRCFPGRFLPAWSTRAGWSPRPSNAARWPAPTRPGCPSPPPTPGDAGTLPIGVMVELEERADAAHGAWHVSDTLIGNEVLALARDGVPLGLSVGFAEVPGGSRWSADRQRVTRTRAALDHVAVVRVPAYQGAGVVGVRRRVAPTTPVLLTLLRRHG
jgi:hypothetical protein